MALALIPQPQNVKEGRGFFEIPKKGFIGIPDESFAGVAGELKTLFPRHAVSATVSGVDFSMCVVQDAQIKPEGYDLAINENGVVIFAADARGAFYGVQTLKQIAQQCPKGKLKKVQIEDWPEFKERGLYYDVCRGRVSRVESLLEQADLLAHAKLNHLQYYVKHTFTFRKHPLIGRNCGSLTPDEVLTVDKRCGEKFIDFVPSLASFGHMDRILEHEPYRYLAEDKACHDYVEPEDLGHPVVKAWAISPAVEGAYEFIDELWSEFLPLFSSKRFNICCDETFDFGWGQSNKLCKEKGQERAYLDHILKLREMAAKYGKEVMFWGDIISSYPERVGEVPEDSAVINWCYRPHSDPDEKVSVFDDYKGDVLTSPTVMGHCTLFPAGNFARRNIVGHAQAARNHSGAGILNTNWGDGGHFASMESAWFGYWFGAEQSWNPDADQKSFTRRFCKLFFGCDDAALVRAVDVLNEWSSIQWYFIFFAPPGDGMLTKPIPHIGEEEKLYFAKLDGTLRSETMNAKLGLKVMERLGRARDVLQDYSKRRGVDSHGVLAHWVFGADCTIHAAKKLTVLGTDGEDSKTARLALARDMEKLMARFEKLWLSSCKRSEISICKKLAAKALKGLKSDRVVKTGPIAKMD